MNESQMMGDKAALDRIQAVMSGVEWDPQTLEDIAEIVTASGREIIDPTEYIEPAELSQDDPRWLDGKDEPHNHSWVIDYAGRKETCHDCGLVQPLATKINYVVQIENRQFFVSGYDVDEAIGMAVAMSRIDGNADPIGNVVAVKVDDTRARLEYLRSQIRAESISMSEVAELQSLADQIDPDDVELLEWAGVPEFATKATVIVPAEVWVEYERDARSTKGRVTKVTVLPKEGDAGYFGPKTQVWESDGDRPLDIEGEFWPAMSEYLENQNLPDGEFIATWEG